ncbi:MAG: DUF2721 domain-containing protein [Anaerolineales bacterium]
MSEFGVSELIPVLQTAIGPVILISGVGLLLLTMTNRLGRVIDRARWIDEGYPDLPENEKAQKRAQLSVLWRRARMIRLSITLASTSALFAAILIVILFATALLQLEDAWLISLVFVICIMTLIASLLIFIHDINQSLVALRLELDDGDLNNR